MLFYPCHRTLLKKCLIDRNVQERTDTNGQKCKTLLMHGKHLIMFVNVKQNKDKYEWRSLRETSAIMETLHFVIQGLYMLLNFAMSV